jgi:hypothetical protein
MSEPTLMRLERPDAARLLLNQKAQTCLSALIQSEHTAASLARAVTLPLNVVAYWVRQLHLAGLLEVTTNTPHKRYRTLAEAFFAPFQRMRAESLRALYHGIQQPFLEAQEASFAALMLEQGSDWGVCLSVPDGQPTLTVVDETRNITLNSRRADAPATVNLAGSIQLDFETAKAMQHELIELYLRYASKGGAQTYMVRLASVPLENPG